MGYEKLLCIESNSGSQQERFQTIGYIIAQPFDWQIIMQKAEQIDETDFNFPHKE